MTDTQVAAIPEATVNAYRKVLIERDGLSLEINKLEMFLLQPKYVSDKMIAEMKNQLHHMVCYIKTLNERLRIFRAENVNIDENLFRTRGEHTIGTFNSDNNSQVEEIKNRATQLVNAIDAFGNSNRRSSIAITHIEEGTMMAVKSIHTK